MLVSTSIYNFQQFVFNGVFLQRIKFEGGREQKRRVTVPYKERPKLLAIFKDESLEDCEKWKKVAAMWNGSVTVIFQPLVEKCS